jgi:hypothetical protein
VAFLKAMLLHPAINAFPDIVQLAGNVETLLKADTEIIVIIESLALLLGNKFLSVSSRHENFTEWLIERFPTRVWQLDNGTVLEYSTLMAKKKAQIILVGFPYPELRKISVIVEHNDPISFVEVNWTNGCIGKPTNLSEINTSCVRELNKDEYKPLEENEFLNISGNNEVLHIFSRTYTSQLFSCVYKKKDHVIKSLKKAYSDYPVKVGFLVVLKRYFDESNTKNLLPKAICRQDNSFRGFIMEKASIKNSLRMIANDTSFKLLAEKYNIIANRQALIKILLNLSRIIALYHIYGVYLSDIKLDNFFIEKDLSIIPIDTDGFSVMQSSASPPKLEMRPPSCLSLSEPYYPNASMEDYAFSSMVYHLLMNDNHPIDYYMYGNTSNTFCKRENPYRLESLLSADKEQMNDNPKLAALHIRWQSLPEYIRNKFIESFINGKTPSVEQWVPIFQRYYDEMTLDSVEVSLKGSSKVNISQWKPPNPKIELYSKENEEPIILKSGQVYKLESDDIAELKTGIKESQANDRKETDIKEETHEPLPKTPKWGKWVAVIALALIVVVILLSAVK